MPVNGSPALQRLHRRRHRKTFCDRTRSPSTTAPMTWWIFPSRAASVEAKRTACLEMGAKARAAWVGLTERKDRWNWLQFIESAGAPSSIGFSGIETHLLNIV